MLVIGLTFTLVALGQKNDPEGMLGEGLHQEEVEGNCKEAIKTYQKVTEKKDAPRNVMARAQLHIGICREKLALQESRAAYQEVVEKYADQREIATEASRRMASLGSESKSLPMPARMPKDFIGDWSGIVEEPLHPHPIYPASIKLSDGYVGTVVGTFGYLAPLDCGGEWKLQSVSPDSIELSEKLRPGTNSGCLTGAVVTLKLGSQGTLEYRWTHDIVPNVATATLSKAANAAALPKGFIGTWEGIVDEPLHPHPRYPASVRLFDGYEGTVVGTFAYLDPLDCGGEWTLWSVSSDSIKLFETLRPGMNQGCISGAVVTLRLASNGTLEYRWSHGRVPNVATATLRKSVSQEQQ